MPKPRLSWIVPAQNRVAMSPWMKFAAVRYNFPRPHFSRTRFSVPSFRLSNHLIHA